MNSPSRFVCLTGNPATDRDQMLERGATVLHAPSGTFIRDAGGGDLSMTVPVITGVAIADWADVADHWIESGDSTLTHHIRFHAGGTVQVVLDLDGEITRLDCERTNPRTDFQTGVVTVSPYGKE